MSNASGQRPIPSGLAKYWNGPVSDFANVDVPTMEPGEQERHRVYSLCLMALMSHYWNGNKYGENGNYGAWRSAQQAGTLTAGGTFYEGGTYLGHNIAALAVDGLGRVIDYEFNHNNVFDSSVEHAESRLVRRLFALNQVWDDWETNGPARLGAESMQRRVPPRFARHRDQADAIGLDVVDGTTVTTKGYSSLLADVTIYTSLESCAQCSGIMTLASVENIVYLHWDQGEFLVGNLMYNATHSTNEGFTAPLPIPASSFGLAQFDQLNAGTDDFNTRVVDEPFYVFADGSTANTPSVTSFLCTDSARQIYVGAAAEFGQLAGALQYPGWAPTTPGALTNAAALDNATAFLSYATSVGTRGTPHRV
jgi:tRNA(Arg) A34 adenosine deaminase TadA